MTGKVEQPHELLMRRAMQLARLNPRHPFGSVIADSATGTIVAEGSNRSEQNPVLHGEIDAINHCADQKQHIDWSKLSLYTTAEPCPMCMAAILWCGIPSVVFGTSIPTLLELGWDQIDLRADVVVSRSHRPATQVTGGVLQHDCDELFRLAAAS
ncbi:MAG: nucleoside deaminase [Planctomycetaceae bacterium]